MAAKTKAQKTEARTILENAQAVKIDDVVTQVNRLQGDVLQALSHLTGSLSGKAQEIEQLDAAIQLKQERLKELFNIEEQAQNLEEFRQHTANERAEWERQRQERERRWKEEDEDRSRAAKRQQDQVKYEFDTQMQQARVQEQLRKEALERTWVERDNALQAREKELTDLRSQVAGIDQRIAAAVKDAETRSAASVRTDYEYRLKAQAQDHLRVSEAAKIQATAYESQLAMLQRQIADLKQELLAARQDAREVATQALQSASGRQVADALARVVDTGNKDKAGR